MKADSQIPATASAAAQAGLDKPLFPATLTRLLVYALFLLHLLLLAAVVTLARLATELRLSLKALLPVILCGALLLPWAIHNYRTFGLFTPTSVVTGEGVVVPCLGLVGAWLALLRVRGRVRLAVVASVCALLYFTLTLCWFHTEARYTIPVRLVLLALAAYALKVLLEVCCAGLKSERVSAA